MTTRIEAFEEALNLAEDTGRDAHVVMFMGHYMAFDNDLMDLAVKQGRYPTLLKTIDGPSARRERLKRIRNGFD